METSTFICVVDPTVEVDGLNLKNPPWADRELMFGANA